MLLFPPPSEFRKRRGRTTRTPPVALTLVAAQYDQTQEWVRLTFDRPIEVALLVAGQITVDDGPLTGTLWEGVGSTLIAPATVQIALGAFDPSSSAQTVLNASAATGTVAVDDGGTWAGATNLLLPFP